MLHLFKFQKSLLRAFFSFYLIWTVNGAPKPDAHEEMRKCNFYFEKQQSSDKIFLECTDKLGLTGKVPEPKAPSKEIDKYYETLRKNNFDDKCLLKCIMDKLNLSNEDGSVNKKELEALQKGNLTQSVQQQAAELMKTCETKIGSMPEFDLNSGKSEEIICKKIAAQDECLYIGSKNFKNVC